nr:4Fe-4S binding protein [Ruminococcus sp. OA3]
MIYFSPTGGTQKVVRTLGKCWESKPQEIDLTDSKTEYGRYHVSGDTFCIIGVPSFGGRVPAPALERIAKIRADKSPALIVTAYGNRDYDDTLLELKECAGKAGFCVTAAVSAVTEHSITRQYGTGRPDKNDRRQLAEFGKTVRERILKSEDLTEVRVKGSSPYRKYSGVPLKPKAGRGCTQCGLCARKCPVSAIPVDNCRKTDRKTCISCMRCVQVCPQKVRTVNGVLLKIAGRKLRKVCRIRKQNELYQ